ncbi:MAG: molecular chaperone HtpG [Synergistaceae bacterium]|jgi:molecular chaperone HtpG|nr:molecular chaperone HtpG [Synergistaceae bacterium]
MSEDEVSCGESAAGSERGKNEKAEKFEFQSEAKQVLELMIHSVYSNPDIFLRELVSNASDAIDKLRIEALTDDKLSEFAKDGRIDVLVDRGARRVAVSDNGVGMSRDELISYLGTIARSGTKEFVRAVREAAASGNADLIGQFGIGFYSSFIVADSVTVSTRRAGTGETWVWSSSGDGSYEIQPGERDSCGTDVSLRIKERDTHGEEDPDVVESLKDYLSEWTLRGIIKRYSDFVSYPIYVADTGKAKSPDEKPDEKPAPANSMKAIWIRPEGDVTDDEYKEFYRHITHDWEDPMERVVYRAEGASEFHALLYIPSRPPVDLFYREGKHGVQLYIRRVFIMNDCRDLIPEYMRFVKGVVDSEDLSLNVSRELLQQDRRTVMIKSGVTRKILDTLRRMKEDRPDDYKKFWDAFGIVLKEGIVSDSRNREAIMKLCSFESSKGGRTTLQEYAASMADGQKSVYYLAGGEAGALSASPKLEAFRERGVEVLLLCDPVDEIWVQTAPSFEGSDFVSISGENVEIPGSPSEDSGEPGEKDKKAEKTKKIEESGIAGRLKEAVSKLGGFAASVDDVRMSSRLVDSPATFVQKGERISPQMRNFFKSIGQGAPEEKRVLELNPSHRLIEKISEASEDDMEKWATLLLGLASIADGERVENAKDFTKTLVGLLEK